MYNVGAGDFGSSTIHTVRSASLCRAWFIFPEGDHTRMLWQDRILWYQASLVRGNPVGVGYPVTETFLAHPGLTAQPIYLGSVAWG